ncbi:hypothetical protein AB0E77_28240, partial [Streptomyces sp. NPDC032940]|uniref:hypothetical protein n=1 Tax=Streptomyces sp. NPDC032940 TaxID=3155366 RepID=UPI0033EE4991
MGTDPMADDAYQPTGTNEEQADAAPLDLQDAVDERDYDETLDEGYSPPEKPLGVTRHGTTAAEQHDGETLDERLAQEEPEVSAPDGDGVGDKPGGEGEPVDPEAGTERSAGVSEVFVNLARRSQVLLHKQLTLLDTMERR